MTTRIRETGILCPECEIPLVHIPMGPDAHDLAACPVCGTGGDYTEIVEKGGTPTPFKFKQIRELLKQYGFTRGS